MSSKGAIERWCDLLRDLMQEAEVTPEAIEQRLGWPPGRLTAALGPGPPGLEVSWVLDLLAALDHPPERFFARLYGGRDLDSLELERLVDQRVAAESTERRHELGRVRALVDQALRASRDPGPVDLDQIQNLVEEALDTELRRLTRSERGHREG
ncbi:MAG: hypothetical protein AAF604_10360 [Acidobacteriota bacterium]